MCSNVKKHGRPLSILQREAAKIHKIFAGGIIILQITKIMEVNMNDFIPYEKLSKKKKRELDNARRSTWGALSPVTRRPVSPKAYNRSKARKWNYDDSASVL